jgi:hypothetical protein
MFIHGPLVQGFGVDLCLVQEAEGFENLIVKILVPCVGEARGRDVGPIDLAS